MVTHTEAQWELSQGEVHDLRVLLDAVGGGVHCVNEGIWTWDKFSAWWADAKQQHAARQLERFKNVTRRYGYSQTEGYR